MRFLRYIRTCKCILIILAAGMVFSHTVWATETIEILSPEPSHFAGQPLIFRIHLKEFISPQQIIVFYRPFGVMVIRQRASTLIFPSDDSRSKARVHLPFGAKYHETIMA